MLGSISAAFLCSKIPTPALLPRTSSPRASSHSAVVGVDGGLLWSGALTPQAVIPPGRWTDRFDMLDGGVKESRHPSYLEFVTQLKKYINNINKKIKVITRCGAISSSRWLSRCNHSAPSHILLAKDKALSAGACHWAAVLLRRLHGSAPGTAAKHSGTGAVGFQHCALCF